MSNYSQRTMAEATALVAKRMPLVCRIDELKPIADNPVCGKPGRGFKAAAKAKREIWQLRLELKAVDDEINNWIKQNGKASMATRGKRFDVYTMALNAWQA